MKKQNGFIATSLLYTFFLAFVTLFIGVVTLHLQNRVYLNKLEDSSKNAIYLRQMKEAADVQINGNTSRRGIVESYEGNIFTYEYIDLSGNTISTGNTCNFAKCESIYYYFDDDIYILEGCDSTC